MHSLIRETLEQMHDEGELGLHVLMSECACPDGSLILLGLLNLYNNLEHYFECLHHVILWTAVFHIS